LSDDRNNEEPNEPEKEKPGLDNDVPETPRSEQDSIPVDGEQVIDMPEGTEYVERGSIQG